MNNKYFNELIPLVEDFELFFHKKMYELHFKGSRGRYYKNFDAYYAEIMKDKDQEAEKYSDPNREISEEKRKMIKDMILAEKSIFKEGLEFIVYTMKTKFYIEQDNDESNRYNFELKSHIGYVTSVILHCEETIDGKVIARDIQNLFVIKSKTKTKAQRDFEKTYELVNDTDIDKLINMIKDSIKTEKKELKEKMDKEIEKKKRNR